MYNKNVENWWLYFGEVKLGVTLYLLARGNALNLGVIFDIASHICHIIV